MALICYYEPPIKYELLLLWVKQSLTIPQSVPSMVIYGIVLPTSISFRPRSFPVVKPTSAEDWEIVTPTMDLVVRDIPPDSSFHIVAHVLEHHDGTLHCRGLSPDQHFVVVDAPSIDKGIYTFYDLVKASQDHQTCMFGETTEALPHLPKDDFQTITLLDLCSGMGGFSIGSQILGLKTMAFVERNPLACGALRANFTSPVIEGDISDVKVLKQVHRLKGNTFLQITGGFPCQGYSKQGDLMGLEDHRSHSLYYILSFVWFLQADAAFLECVANVLQFPCTQACIDHFAKMANMHCKKLTLDLQHQWPVRRNRFWCHLISKDHPNIELPSWPISQDFACLSSVMPMDAIWDIDEEKILEWDDVENAIYMDVAYGHDQRLLQPNDKAPTFLHSWGHVSRPCPCGCRAAFSDARLRKHGARGFGLRSMRSGKMRHLHPAEGALLCTVPPTFAFPGDPRAALSLLGQIAAPLQVLWLQAHILAGLQLFHWGWTGIDPLQCISALQQHLVNHPMLSWITPRMFQTRCIKLQIENETFILEVMINQPLTVEQLAAAEKSLCGWGHYAIVKYQGVRLSPTTLLHSDVIYTVELRKSMQVKSHDAVTDIYGGGSIGAVQCLGDKLLWTFMQALTRYYTELYQRPSPFMLYPFRAQHFLDLHAPAGLRDTWQCQFHRSSHSIYVIFEISHHWVLLVGQWASQSNGLSWTLYDGLRDFRLLPVIYQVAHKLCDLLEVRMAELSACQPLEQRHAFTCGTIALVHLALDLCLTTMPDESEIQLLHAQLLAYQHGGSIFAGGPADPQSQLAALIADKGVPVELAPERAQQIIKRLGTTLVLSILQSKHPWADLKSAASKPGHLFRIVTTEEQTAYVAKRAQTQHGAQLRNHKAKKSARNQQKPGPVHLDPDQFELDSAHFQDDDDNPVPQISFVEVEADRRGVALCTTSMAMPFLESPHNISVEALALLIVDTPSPEMLESTSLDKIVIPARCRGTNEHTLIFGHILQLGDLTVKRTFTGECSSPDIINTKVIKFQIFRDQLQADWQSFVNAPVRALVAMMEALQLCNGKSCGADCAKFHAGLDEQIDNVIFEIWARSFFDDQGHKVAATSASLFTVFMRIPAEALAKILASTPLGVYAEPRGQRPREQDEHYSVIWLPGCNHEEAAHKCRTFSKAICLIRLRNKYGIRVAKEDDQTAWSHLRPGVDYMDITIKYIFELFPLPHGTQRHAVSKLLSDWGWHARPLQPGKGSFHHMAWRVGSDTQPPHPVLKGFDNDIVITAVKEIKNNLPPTTLIASTRTQKHLRAAPDAASSATSTTDPWLERAKDPWANFKPKTMAPAAGEGKHRLEELRSQLCKDVQTHVSKGIEDQAQAALKAVASSSTGVAQSHEGRLQALEFGMKELHSHHAQFSTWFQQAGERMQATENAVGAVQNTLNTHQQEIHTLGSTFQSTMKNIQNDLSHEMSDKFNMQLSRLEALLEKKQRSS